MGDLVLCHVTCFSQDVSGRDLTRVLKGAGAVRLAHSGASALAMRRTCWG